MITKRLLMLIGFVIMFYTVNAQYKITGRVSDEKQNPLELVHISLLQNDSLIWQTMTDSLGMFQFDNMATGLYNLALEYWGKTKRQPVTVTDSDLTLNIVFDSITQYLSGITVEGKRPVFKKEIDRLVFNVENNIITTGGSALDVLKITPGVNVKQNDIIITGKSGVTVLLNDRPVQMTGEELINLLKTIPADDIKAIEVITTPPGKYDGEGNSGIINIVFKKGRRESWSNSIRAAYIQTTYGAYNLGNTYNFNKKKVHLSASIAAQKGYQGGYESGNIFYPSGEWNSQSNEKHTTDYLSGRLGFDYDIDKNTTIGIQYLGGLNRPGVNDHNNVTIQSLAHIDSAYINSSGDNYRSNHHNAVNLHFIHSLDSTGKQISADVDYFNHTSTQDRNFTSAGYLPNGTSLSTLSANNKSSQSVNNYSAKIDITHPVRFARFSYGAKYTVTQTNSAVHYFNTTSGSPVLDPMQSDSFTYHENIFALYADVFKQLSEKWQIKMSLRLENTATKGISKTYGQENNRNYTRLFPTVYLLHIIDENNTLNLSYNRRLDRPAFWELNPFRFYLNATSYAVGNPFLQPSFSDNVTLAFSHKDYWISTLFFQNVTDGFSQVPTINTKTQQQVFTRLNYFTAQAAGFSQVYVFRKFKWWKNMNSVAVFYSDYSFNNSIINMQGQSGWGMNFSTNNSFFINKGTLSGELNAWYAPANNAGGLYRVNASYSVDVGLKYVLLNQKLQLAFSVNDIFKTSTPTVTTYTNGIRQAYYIYNDDRHFKITATYTFGNKNILMSEHETGNTDEKNRTR